jgi:hypothetical protein
VVAREAWPSVGLQQLQDPAPFAVEHTGTNLQEMMAPALRQRICCFFTKRRLTI